MTIKLTDKIKRVQNILGLQAGIELEPGDIRWPNSTHPRTMTAAYAHIRGYYGLDNKSLDAYIGSNTDSVLLFLVRQLKQDGTLDEYKLILCCDSIEQARDLYFAHMPQSLGFFGGIEEITLDKILEFKKLNDSAIPKTFNCALSDKVLNPKESTEVQEETEEGKADAKKENPLTDSASSNLTDKVQATIRLSRAEYQNENEREYTSESMMNAANEANRLIEAGLTLVGYDDEDIRNNLQEAGHPEEVFTESGEFVGYNYNQYQPAFKFNRFEFQENTKELLASIEALDKLEAGSRFASKLSSNTPIKFSLRALGSCKIDPITGKEICNIDQIEGGDAVKYPALEDAQPLSINITDNQSTKAHSIKDCCSNCKQGLTCEQTKEVAKINKSINIISQVTDNNNVKQLNSNISLVNNNLGEKANAVSPAKYKNIRKLGDTIMNPEILKMIVSEPDQATREKLGAMAEMMMSGVPSIMEAELEAKEDPLKKEDPMMPKEKDPMVEMKEDKPVYDATYIADSIKKGIADGLKTATASIKAELNSELSILDEQKKEKAEKQAKQAVTDHITQIVTSNNFEGRKLENYSETDLQDAIDLASTKSTVEDCNKSLKDSFALIDKKKARAIAKGEITTVNSKGVVVLLDEAEKQYKQPLSKILDAVDACEKTRNSFRGRIHQGELAQVNKKILDELWDARMKHPVKGRAIADWARRAIKDDANPVTVDDLRNQEGVLAGVIEKQAFQKLLAMQWVRSLGPSFARGDLGREFKILSTGFTPPPAGTSRIDGEVREGEAYGESVSYQRFNKFFTKLRGRAIRIGKELQIALKTGVLKLDAVARLIADVSDEMARLTDTIILKEIHTHIAEYGKTLISAQAVASTEWTYSAGGAPTVNIGGDIGNVTFGSTVKGVAIILTGDNTTTTLHTANDRTVHPAPIVPGRTTVTVDDDGNETVTDNKDATIATLGGITQVEGHFINGDIVNKGDGTIATYAVAKELGCVVFKETAVSGAAAGVRPTVTCYYDRNYDEFNLTPSANVKPEEHYSGILRLVNAMCGIGSGTPHYANYDLMIQQTSVARGSVCNADLFYNKNQPGNLVLDRGFAATNYINDLYGVDFMHSNGEFFGGARRAYLYERENMTAYFISQGMNFSLQNQSTKAAGNIVDGVFYGSRNVPIPEYFWTCDVVDGTGTPTVLDTNGAILQCKGRSIRFVGNLAVVRSS